MTLLNKLFGAQEPKEERNLPWISLDRLSQLDTIIEKSNEKAQLIFKHSTRCGISRMVLRQFEAEYALSTDAADLYYLDLLKHRNISNEIASRCQVYHESPQLLIVKNGQVVKQASHSDITGLNLLEVVNN